MPQQQDFSELAKTANPGLIGEFWLFLAHTKKWWLMPILVVVVLLTVLVVLSATPLAPFIYTLF